MIGESAWITYHFFYYTFIIKFMTVKYEASITFIFLRGFAKDILGITDSCRYIFITVNYRGEGDVLHFQVYQDLLYDSLRMRERESCPLPSKQKNNFMTYLTDSSCLSARYFHFPFPSFSLHALSLSLFLDLVLSPIWTVAFCWSIPASHVCSARSCNVYPPPLILSVSLPLSFPASLVLQRLHLPPEFFFFFVSLDNFLHCWQLI